MLAIYNETHTNWTLTKINERVSKVSITKKNKRDKTLFLELLGNADVLNSAFAYNAEEIPSQGVLYSGNTTVRYQRKDLKPFVGTTDNQSSNADILLLSFDMKGRMVIDIPKTNAYVLGYMFADSELFMIVSMKAFTGRDNKQKTNEFKIKYASTEDGRVGVYTFVKEGNDYITRIQELDEIVEISKPTYKITRFKPTRPTYLIYTLSEEYEVLKATYKFADKSLIKSFNGTTSLKEVINEARDERYKVCTLFIDSEQIDDTYQTYYDMLKENFGMVYVLNSSGKTVLLTK